MQIFQGSQTQSIIFEHIFSKLHQRLKYKVFAHKKGKNVIFQKYLVTQIINKRKHINLQVFFETK